MIKMLLFNIPQHLFIFNISNKRQQCVCFHLQYKDLQTSSVFLPLLRYKLKSPDINKNCMYALASIMFTE